MPFCVAYNKVQQNDYISSNHLHGTPLQKPVNLSEQKQTLPTHGSVAVPVSMQLLCDCVDQLPCIKRSTTSLHVTVRATWPSPRMMPTAIKPTVRGRNKLLQHTRAFVNSLTVLNGSLERQYHLYASGSTHTLPEKLGHITQVVPIYAFVPGNPYVYDRTLQLQITIVCERQHTMVEVIAVVAY